MKVAIFNNMVTPYTNALYNGIVDCGVDLHIISCTEVEKNRRWGEVGLKRYRHTILPGFFLKLGHGRFAHFNRGVGKTLRQEKPDLIVINGFYPTMIMATIWSLISRVPILISIDGWRETMPNSIYHKIVRPAVVRAARHIITCGLRGREYFSLEYGCADKVDIVPLAPAWQAPAVIPNFNERNCDILFVAHFNDEVKNAKFVEEVLLHVSKMKPGLHVRAVGTGPAQDRFIRNLADAPIKITHDTHLPWQELQHLYTDAKVLLLPSLWEPWGLVCNEAMQCGVPCIVSPHVGAAFDLVSKESGGDVLDLDVTAWSNAIFQLLNDEACWNYRSSRAVDKHRGISAEKSASKITDILRKVTQ